MMILDGQKIHMAAPFQNQRKKWNKKTRIWFEAML